MCGAGFALGGFSSSFQGYYRSGFLSLQEALDRSIVVQATSGGEAGGGAAAQGQVQSRLAAMLSSLSYGLPMPRAAYEVNIFLQLLGTFLPLVGVFSLVIPLVSIVKEVDPPT